MTFSCSDTSVLSATATFRYVVLYAIVLSHTYAESEAVESHTSVLVGVGSPPVMSPLPSYCNNPTYDAFLGAPPDAFAGVFFGPNISCRPFDRMSHVSSPTTGVVTLATTLLFGIANHTPSLISRFTVGSELSPITFVHQYQTPSGFFRGENPRTRLHGPSGSVILDVPAGSPIFNLPLSVWLAAAGADLDSINALPPNPPSSWPHFRNTGVILRVRVEYSNLRNGEWPVFGSDEVRADITVKFMSGQPAFTDTLPIVDPELGAAVVLRTGVRLEVEGAGLLRHTTLVATVLALVQVGARGAWASNTRGPRCPAQATSFRLPTQIVVLLGIGDVVTRHFAFFLYWRQPAYRTVTRRTFQPPAEETYRVVSLGKGGVAVVPEGLVAVASEGDTASASARDAAVELKVEP